MADENDFVKRKGKSTVFGKKKQISCPSCSRECAIIFETEVKTEPQRYQCLCPCGSKTMVVKSENRCHFIPAANLKIDSWDTTNNNYVIKLVMEK